MIEKLTFEKAVENKFTMQDCIKHYFPDITDEEIEFILWEKTCFPFSDETSINQLYTFYLETVESKNESQKD